MRPLHHNQLLLHPLHSPAIRNPCLHAEALHGCLPLQTEYVLREALNGAVLTVQSHQGFFKAAPQWPENAGEHGSLQCQVCKREGRT